MVIRSTLCFHGDTRKILSGCTSYLEMFFFNFHTFFSVIFLLAGGTITIDGSSFGSSGSVYIGSKPAVITSFSDSQVVVEVESVDAGIQMVKVETSDGFALNV